MIDMENINLIKSIAQDIETIKKMKKEKNKGYKN